MQLNTEFDGTPIHLQSQFIGRPFAPRDFVSRYRHIQIQPWYWETNILFQGGAAATECRYIKDKYTNTGATHNQDELQNSFIFTDRIDKTWTTKADEGERGKGRLVFLERDHSGTEGGKSSIATRMVEGWWAGWLGA